MKRIAYVEYDSPRSRNVQTRRIVREARNVHPITAAVASGDHLFAITAYNDGRIEVTRGRRGTRVGIETVWEARVTTEEQ